IWMARYRWCHAERKHTLYALVDPVSPPWAPPAAEWRWWRRRVLPPGPMGLLRWPFIAIAVAGRANIGSPRPGCKRPRSAPAHDVDRPLDRRTRHGRDLPRLPWRRRILGRL